MLGPTMAARCATRSIGFGFGRSRTVLSLPVSEGIAVQRTRTRGRVERRHAVKKQTYYSLSSTPPLAGGLGEGVQYWGMGGHPSTSTARSEREISGTVLTDTITDDTTSVAERLSTTVENIDRTSFVTRRPIVDLT